MTEFQSARLKELERKLSENMCLTESFRDALEIWQAGAFPETLTDRHYKSCLTVLELAMCALLEKETEMQEVLEHMEKGG